MASQKASKGETVIPSGTGGKSLEAQEHLAEGSIRDGETRMEQLGREGYQEIGHKDGLNTSKYSCQERAEQEGSVETDESKYRTKSRA